MASVVTSASLFLRFQFSASSFQLPVVVAADGFDAHATAKH
jgi:hypothetical protein